MVYSASAQKPIKCSIWLHKASYIAIRGKNTFTWPEKEDCVDTLNQDILIPLSDIVPLNNRGFFGVCHRDLLKINSAMVSAFCYILAFSVPPPPHYQQDIDMLKEAIFS